MVGTALIQFHPDICLQVLLQQSSLVLWHYAFVCESDREQLAGNHPQFTATGHQVFISQALEQIQLGTPTTNGLTHHWPITHHHGESHVHDIVAHCSHLSLSRHVQQTGLANVRFAGDDLAPPTQEDLWGRHG